ncbi:MAG: NAD(P)/FAD-dependent oxidoreductase [Candidatus Aminicenantales bacterium]
MQKLKKTAEVVIIGGGIMGLSTAYYIARAGCRDVVLLERDLLAQASTGLSVGGIRQQFSHPANIMLSQKSIKVFENFQEEFGQDINFHQVGYLFLAQRSKTWREFLAGVKQQKAYGIQVEVCQPSEIKYRWPYLCVSDLEGGTFTPRDGYADPYLVAMGFAQAARKLGISLEEKTKAVGIEIKKGKIRKVQTEKGSIYTPVVVNAAGAWAKEVAKMAGLNLPIEPYRRQVFVTKAFPDIAESVPMVIDMDVSFYFRREGPGVLMGKNDPTEPPNFNTNLDWSWLEKVTAAAVHRVPILEKAKILKGWAGLYAVTPDDNPIIGALSEVEGFFCAAGFSGHGFQHGPAVGQILSELILKGKAMFDLSPFAYGRFKQTGLRGERRVV